MRKVTANTLEELRQNGVTEIYRIEENGYCEITTPDNRKYLRKPYYYKNGTAEITLGCILFKIARFNSVVPAAQPKTIIQERIKEVNFSKPTPAPVIIDITKHSKHSIIKSCITADIPVYLVGEAGTGKNFTLQAIAEELDMDFYFTNSVSQEYKVTGFIDAGGLYHNTEFYKAFTNGGIFFLDEMDASIPEVLVLLNAAIANKYFEFPNGKVTAHKDFRVVAAGNTVGSGADELYTGRSVIDSATLDRFVVIDFDYDQNIELMLAKGNKELVNFIRSLRQSCKKQGIRATFSYRAIINITKLESLGISLTEIIKIAVFKGLDKDTIKTLRVSSSGKYYYAFKDAQGVA